MRGWWHDAVDRRLKMADARRRGGVWNGRATDFPPTNLSNLSPASSLSSALSHRTQRQGEPSASIASNNAALGLLLLSSMSFSSLAPRVRRALLYLQGFDRRKIAKASAHPTLDCACLDMEDGVALSKKEDARKGIIDALFNVDFGRTERLVRINGFETGDLARRDLEAVLASCVLPDGIVIPKVESSTDVLAVSQELDALGDSARDVRIVCMIESARALLNINAICAAAPERMDAVIFGADDYASNVGATRTKSGEEMEFARNYMLLHAAAYGVASIDMVMIDFHDGAHLRTESEKSFRQGFSGKQVIHPLQIDVVQEAYSPTPEAIAHAAAVVRAHDEHQLKGEGAFEFAGSMIDAPTVKQFELLLAKARLMGLYDE